MASIEDRIDRIEDLRQEEMAKHQAIGWLLGSLRREHPGFLRSEAERAAASSGDDAWMQRTAAVLASWADREEAES